MQLARFWIVNHKIMSRLKELFIVNKRHTNCIVIMHIVWNSVFKRESQQNVVGQIT